LAPSSTYGFSHHRPGMVDLAPSSRYGRLGTVVQVWFFTPSSRYGRLGTVVQVWLTGTVAQVWPTWHHRPGMVDLASSSRYTGCLLSMPARGQDFQVCPYFSVSVCMSLCSLRGKWLELLTPKLVKIWFVAGPRHALNLRSEGQRVGERHGSECQYE